MKVRKIQFVAAALATVGMMVPHVGLAATPARPTGHAVTDVGLQPGGLLVGQVLDTAGTAQADQEVVLYTGGQEVVRTVTDENGVFAAKGLRGGQYQVIAAHSAKLIRAWAPNTAPPSVQAGSLIIKGDPVVRAQSNCPPPSNCEPSYGGYGMGMGRSVVEWCRSHPWLTTIGIAAAIAIPLALADGDDDPAPGSP